MTLAVELRVFDKVQMAQEGALWPNVMIIL